MRAAQLVDVGEARTEAVYGRAVAVEEEEVEASVAMFFELQCFVERILILLREEAQAPADPIGVGALYRGQDILIKGLHALKDERQRLHGQVSHLAAALSCV